PQSSGSAGSQHSPGASADPSGTGTSPSGRSGPLAYPSVKPRRERNHESPHKVLPAKVEDANAAGSEHSDFGVSSEREAPLLGFDARKPDSDLGFDSEHEGERLAILDGESLSPTSDTVATEDQTHSDGDGSRGGRGGPRGRSRGGSFGTDSPAARPTRMPKGQARPTVFEGQERGRDGRRQEHAADRERKHDSDSESQQAGPAPPFIRGDFASGAETGDSNYSADMESDEGASRRLPAQKSGEDLSSIDESESEGQRAVGGLRRPAFGVDEEVSQTSDVDSEQPLLGAKKRTRPRVPTGSMPYSSAEPDGGDSFSLEKTGGATRFSETDTTSAPDDPHDPESTRGNRGGSEGGPSDRSGPRTSSGVKPKRWASGSPPRVLPTLSEDEELLDGYTAGG
ncbi:unnamed protein product, partial [Amoebophrya sp. A25]